MADEFEAGQTAADESQRLEAVLEQARRALALLESGNPDLARVELGSLLAEPPPLPAFDGQVGDDELEKAFESAESDPSEMHDANRVAERVLDQTDPDPLLAEVVAGESQADPNPLLEQAFTGHRHSPFSTETMAGLLEGQGHSGPAQAIRETLYVEPWETEESEEASGASDADAGPEPGEAFAGIESSDDEASGVVAASQDPAVASRLRTQVTLEGWLENVRRNVA